MKTPEDARKRQIYDFKICYGAGGLASTLRHINDFGCEVISVTKNGTEYTVVFRRCVA